MKVSKAWRWLAAFSASRSQPGCGGDDDEARPVRPGRGAAAAEQVITVNWGTEPPSLDPGLATDTTSANILLNIMDPLVKLGDDLEPVPNAGAELGGQRGRQDRHVHAPRRRQVDERRPGDREDFEYSWKRTISPELAADYAYQFYGIVGAHEYNGCEARRNCEALADKVGVKAVDDQTLEVKLTSPQPWFIQQAAHHSFLAVNRKATVEQFGTSGPRPQNIVTNGPFKLAVVGAQLRIDLVKWDEWRDADDVTLTRVNGRMITDGRPPCRRSRPARSTSRRRCRPRRSPGSRRPRTTSSTRASAPTTTASTSKNIPDVNQRRAMSLAINRREIIDNIAQADQLPATGFTPEGMPGFDAINPNSQWLPENGDMEQAKQLMDQVARTRRRTSTCS